MTGTTVEAELEYRLNPESCGSVFAGRYVLDVELGAVRRTPSPQFIEAVKALAARLNVDHRWVLAVMDHESGIDPQAFNKKSRATGLIQFIPSTAKDLGTSVEQLAKMSDIEQLPYVERYLRQWKPLRTASDVAAAVFYPRAIGDLGLVIGSKGQKTYDWNDSLDKDRKGYITMVDYARSLRKYGWRWGVEMSDVDGYLVTAKNAKTFRDLNLLNAKILAENPKSAEAQSIFVRFAETLKKLPVAETSPPVYQGVDYRESMIPKIRGAFRIQSDYSPTAKDYVEAGLQTVSDVKEKSVQAAEQFPGAAKMLGIGFLAIIGLGLFSRVKGGR